MGQFGRITKLSDLPSKKVLTEYIKLAKKLNDDGVKAPTRVKKAASRAGRSRRSGQGTRSKTRQLRRRLTSSVQQQTRIRGLDHRGQDRGDANKRLETAIEWMAEGKTRNWKYMNC